MKECKFEGCGKPVNALGLCAGHYQQKVAGKELKPLRSKGKVHPWIGDHKVCSGCGENKHRDDYYKGNTARCKVCTNKQNAEWKAKNNYDNGAKTREWIAKNEGLTYTDKSTGYVVYFGFNHPAANKSGVTRYHRIVLWDKLNGQNAYCHWGCGTFLYWEKSYPEHKDALVTDHLNGIRDDNRPENLVPCCNKCNGTVSRASRKEFIECQYGPCDRDAAIKGYCKVHYTQKWAGKELKPIRHQMTDEQEQEIVERISAGEQIVPLGEEYGFDFSAISRMFKRRTGMGIREFKSAKKAGLV